MEKVWILEIAEANNCGYESDYFIYDNYEKALQILIEKFTSRMKDAGYSDEEIQDRIEDPACDSEGNDIYYDDDDEFYFKLLPAQKGE